MPGPIECRLLPHTGYLLLPATLSAMAWVAVVSQDGCDYARLNGPSVQSLTGSNLIPYVEVGRSAYRVPVYYSEDAQWRVPYTEECASYEGTGAADSANGWAWKTSQVVSFLALAFGGAGSLFLWVGACTILSRTMWRAAGFEALAACAFQCVSFLWFVTPMCDSGAGNSCSMHFGSKSDAAAAGLWGATAALVLWRYPNPWPKPTIVPEGDEDSETAEMIGTRSNVGTSRGNGSQISFGDGYGGGNRRGSGTRRYSANSDGGFM